MRLAVAFVVLLGVGATTMTTAAVEVPAPSVAASSDAGDGASGWAFVGTQRDSKSPGTVGQTARLRTAVNADSSLQIVDVSTRFGSTGAIVSSNENEPNDEPSNANSIRVDSTVRGTVSTVTDIDAFTVPVDAGARVAVELRSLEVGGTLQVVVYGPELGAVESMYVSGGGQNSLEFRPHKSGQYHVVVSSVRNRDPTLKPGTGEYVLVVRTTATEDDSSTPTPTPTSSDGRTADGEVTGEQNASADRGATTEQRSLSDEGESPTEPASATTETPTGSTERTSVTSETTSTSTPPRSDDDSPGTPPGESETQANRTADAPPGPTSEARNEDGT